MNTETNKTSISILGGGPAGLAAGYYAQKKGLPFEIFEAGERCGGNCITLEHGDFRFDSGAHRFHDKEGEVTREILDLLGDRIHKINVPSQIYHQGKLIDFPLTPLDLLKKLGAQTYFKAALKLGMERMKSPKQTEPSFRQIALHTYGPVIAEKFLLDYSRKLWGVDTSKLSPEVSGKRLKGLDIRTFMAEALLGKKFKTRHIDGSFYYPELGIGEIMDELEKRCGQEHVHKSSRITKVYREGFRITGIEINGERKEASQEVISTLPVSLLLALMEPAPPSEILKIASKLRFQHLILVALFIDKERISPNASIYFPDKKYLFTRVVEPKNRSEQLSPKGKTSLVAEIPCPQDSSLWKEEDYFLVQKVESQLIDAGLIHSGMILDERVHRIKYAYPVLDLNYRERIQKIMQWLNQFENLHLSGRNGKFQYTHIHDMMRFGKETVEEISSKQAIVT